MKSPLDILSAIERRLRGRAIPVLRAVAAPPPGTALLYVDGRTHAVKLKLSDGTLSTVGGAASSGPATEIRESSGPTTLAVGAVANGQVLKRVGSTVVGAWVAVAMTLVSDGGEALDGGYLVPAPAPTVVAAGAPV
jgi:hypothetical protein